MKTTKVENILVWNWNCDKMDYIENFVVWHHKKDKMGWVSKIEELAFY